MAGVVIPPSTRTEHVARRRVGRALLTTVVLDTEPRVRDSSVRPR
ncbi:hypothetical protein NKH77_04505 [Streptomyces sp. M19]